MVETRGGWKGEVRQNRRRVEEGTKNGHDPLPLDLGALPAPGFCIFFLLECLMIPFCALFSTQPTLLRPSSLLRLE